MIFEAAIGAATVVAVTALARSIANERRRRNEAAEARRVREVDGRNRALRIGDVVTYGSAELWLESRLEFSDGSRTLTLFRGVDTGTERWVSELEQRANELAFLDPSDDLPEGSMPSELRLSGRHLSLRMKGAVTVRGQGPRLPSHGSHAELVVLADAGGKIALVVDFPPRGKRLALVGETVSLQAIDILRGGDVEKTR